MRWWWLPFLLITACGTNDQDLCTRFYQAYPNHIGDRPRTETNAALLDAMAAYDKGDYATASAGLTAVIERDAGDRLSRLYLASALLGAGDPYKAEMHLDFLERVPGRPFKDQTEWYNTLCWLCSGQTDRARAESARIAAKPSHAYSEQARALNKALTTH